MHEYRTSGDAAVVAESGPVRDDRTGFDHAAIPNHTAVDHRGGTDDAVVADEQMVVGEQVQDGVLEYLHPIADANRAVAVTDDLDLDMLWRKELLFQIHAIVAKSRRRLTLSAFQRGR